MRRGFAGLVCLIFVVCAPRLAAAADSEYYIIETEEARTVGEDVLRVEVEAGVRKQGDGSSLYNLPRGRVTYGINDWVDVTYEYELLYLQDGTVVDFTGGPSRMGDAYHSGDLRAQLKMIPYKTTRGDFGFSVEVKGPNASERRGLGTDGPDFTALGLWSLDWSHITDDPFWSKLTTHTNLGFAILANPRANRTHQDFLVWGVAGEYPLTDDVTVFGELEGAVWHNGGAVDNPTVQFGTESSPSTTGRIAFTGPVPIGDGWRWGVSGAKTFGDKGQDWEVQVGLSKAWDFGFERGQTRSTSPEMRYTDPEALFTYYNPMWTQAAYVMGARRVRLESEFGYVEQVDGSDLWIIPEKTVWLGLSDWAEVGASFQYLAVRNTTVARPPTTVVTDASVVGPGDVRLFIRTVPFRTRIGDLGMFVTTKIPSADGSNGLGTGELDVSARVLLSTNWGAVSSTSYISKLTTHVNLGLALVDDPFALSSQNDVFIWGVAAEYALNDDWTYWAEIHGADLGGNTTDNIAEGEYGQDMVNTRMGITGPLPVLGGDWKWAVTAALGLTEHTPNWGALFGISRTWDID